MQVIKDKKSLCAAILLLELQQKSDANLMKEHFKYTIDSLNPINILKEKFNDTIHSPTLTGDIAKGALGLAAGFITNRFLGSSSGIVKNLAGTLLQKGLAKIDLDPEKLKVSGMSMLKNVLDKIKIKV